MSLKELKERWWSRVVEHNLESEATIIKVRGLEPEEAIGRPSRANYPLLEGHEVMLQAEVRGAFGQAFTDEPSGYVGSLSSLYMTPLNTKKNRALLVAAINATYAHLDLVVDTKHCRDEGPELCGKRVAVELASKLPLSSKIAMIGFQPAFTHHISRAFENFRVTDMNPENIGRVKEGVLIEPYIMNREVIAWSNAVLATGSTLANKSIDHIIEWSKRKLLFFYGVTISAAAHEFDFRRFCFESLHTRSR
jgi:hypothetical protein